MMSTEFDEKAATWDDDPIRTERAESIGQSIISAIDITKVNSALEYGSGTGLLSFAMKDHLKQVTLMDESAEMTRITEQKCDDAGMSSFHPLKYDLISDALPVERFDLIYVLLTLHHINDTVLILKKFWQILNPGGQLALVDLESEDGSFHDGEFHGHLGFDRSALETKLTAAGFTPQHYEVCYKIEKETGKRFRYYPLFLLTAQKA